MDNLFRLGNSSKKDQDKELANDIVNWSNGNLTKDQLQKKHAESLDWFGGDKHGS